MARPTTWKEFHFVEHDHMRKLQSYQDSNTGAWAGWIIEWQDGVGILETNMPWAELRRWFSYADVPMSSDCLTADHPSWADYCTCGAGSAAPHKHLKSCEAF